MIKNKSPVIRTYEFKLKSRKSYRKKYDKWIGCCRFIYNLGKEAKDFAYQNFNKTQSHFSCENCGHTGNADVNAAINIKDSGLAEICTIT